MFDISFSELMLIGVIALIVIGPERLPKVARTVGHLLGRAQRYVNDVKTDIRKEMDAAELGNLKDLKDQMQEAAHSVKASVDETSKAWRAPIDEAQEALKQASESVKTLADSARTLREDASAPSSESSGAPDQEMEGLEAIDTRTLPLPGFEREPAVPGDAPADTPRTAKGSQP